MPAVSLNQVSICAPDLGESTRFLGALFGAQAGTDAQLWIPGSVDESW